jgi:hypothetical protein
VSSPIVLELELVLVWLFESSSWKGVLGVSQEI